MDKKSKSKKTKMEVDSKKVTTNVVLISSEDEYLEYINENDIVVIKFSADWCTPCKMLAPKYREMSMKYTDIKFLSVDVDELSSIADEEDISAMPTIIVYFGGKRLHDYDTTGIKTNALEENLNKLMIKA